MNGVRVGLVGAGFMGEAHAERLAGGGMAQRADAVTSSAGQRDGIFIPPPAGRTKRRMS
jgi:predicted homoserine dehydrogenase-like protein